MTKIAFYRLRRKSRRNFQFKIANICHIKSHRSLEKLINNTKANKGGPTKFRHFTHAIFVSQRFPNIVNVDQTSQKARAVSSNVNESLFTTCELFLQFHEFSFWISINCDDYDGKHLTKILFNLSAKPSKTFLLITNPHPHPHPPPHAIHRNFNNDFMIISILSALASDSTANFPRLSKFRFTKW